MVSGTVLRANRYVGGAFVLLGAVLLHGGLRLPQSFAGSLGPGFMPVVIGVLCLVGGITLVAMPGMEGDETLPPWPGTLGAVRVTAMAVGLALHIVLMQMFGYLFAAAVFTYLAWTVLGWFRWWSRAVAAALMAGGLYGLFAVLLEVPLP